MKSRKITPRLGRPRSFDTGEALNQAMQVFWRKGYLGASLSDLTEAMDINRPSLYAAFGNKESLFRKALARYSQGPATYLREALNESTARAAVERLLRGSVDLLTNPRTPTKCLWVHAALSCGDVPDLLRKEFFAQRIAAEAELRARFKRAVAEGDLPKGTDARALARFVQTVNFGLSVQAATGASRKELLSIVAIALQAWPN